MNCWHCGHELIWGGDHDIVEDLDTDGFLHQDVELPMIGNQVIAQDILQAMIIFLLGVEQLDIIK